MQIYHFPHIPAKDSLISKSKLSSVCNIEVDGGWLMVDGVITDVVLLSCEIANGFMKDVELSSCEVCEAGIRCTDSKFDIVLHKHDTLYYIYFMQIVLCKVKI